MEKLKGRIAVVTGANSGMGLATVRALSDAGALVIMLCRSEERGRKALEQLKDKPDRKLDLILCDLGDYSSIRAFAKEVHEKYGHVDILVNNAGFIALDRQETKEGMERQFGINHLGHFLLTTQLLDVMVAAGLVKSKGEGRRLIQQGGVSLNDQKVADPLLVLTADQFEKGYAVIRKGKKIFHKIVLN